MKETTVTFDFLSTGMKTDPQLTKFDYNRIEKSVAGNKLLQETYYDAIFFSKARRQLNITEMAILFLPGIVTGITSEEIIMKDFNLNEQIIKLRSFKKEVKNACASREKHIKIKHWGEIAPHLITPLRSQVKNWLEETAKKFVNSVGRPCNIFVVSNSPVAELVSVNGEETIWTKPFDLMRHILHCTTEKATIIKSEYVSCGF